MTTIADNTSNERIRTPQDVKRLRRDYRRARTALRTLQRSFGTPLVFVCASDVADAVGELHLLGIDVEKHRHDLAHVREALK